MQQAWPIRPLYLALLLLPLCLTWGSSLPGDFLTYQRAADLSLLGFVPYRDFSLEYPPVALLFFLPPAWHAVDALTYGIHFILWMGVCDLVQRLVLLSALPPRRRLLLLVSSSVASSLLCYTYLKRYDVAAALLCTLALCRLQQRPGSRAAWVWLTLAAGCKIYPAVLLPLFWRYSQHRGIDPKQRRAQLATALATGLGIGGIVWLGAGSHSLDWLFYHRDRGLHVASHYTGLACLVRGLGSTFESAFAYGAFEVRAPWAPFCASIAPYVLLCQLGFTYWRLWGKRLQASDLWPASVSLILCLLLGSKVFSPQYMVWLVPVCSMAAAMSETRRSRFGWVIALWVGCWCTAELWPHEHYLGIGVVRKQIFLLLRFAALGAMWWRGIRPDAVVR
jgi:hypothetical protein